MKDALGDRMKGYEREWVPAGRCMPLIPVIVRLDGKNFSRWTRPLKKPFDDRIAAAMTVVTKALVQETNALVGFTQSDEMTLVLYSSDARSSVYFDGKAQKIVSVLAAFATARFNAEAGHLRDEAALFDCRIWQVPNLLEAANAVLWRELDAIKNSIQSANIERSMSMSKEKNGTAKKGRLRLEYMDPEKLAENPLNWRRHPQAQADGLFAQMRELQRSGDGNPWAGAALYNERTQRLVDGHLRKKIPRDLLVDGKMPVLVGNWTEEQEALILATYDPLAEMAERDDEALRVILDSIETEDADVRLLLEAIAASDDDIAEELEGQPPEEFPVVDEGIHVDHECPKCGYQWSGSTEPRSS